MGGVAILHGTNGANHLDKPSSGCHVIVLGICYVFPQGKCILIIALVGFIK